MTTDRPKFLARSAVTILVLGLCTACQPEAKKPNSEPTSGAKPTADAEPEVAPGSREDAKRLIEETLALYRNLTRYSDSGELTIEAPGSAPVTSPFRIALERPNRLALAVHGVRGCWTSTTWEAIDTGPTSPFPNQRMVRPLPAKIDLNWIVNDQLGGLLADPIGLPIQLELLLADRSLSALTDENNLMQFLQRDTLEGRLCDRIRVEKSGLRWVLWIDRENKLLRRMELPPQLFYPGTNRDALEKIRCEVNLTGAVADASIDWTAWQVPPRKEDLLVRRMVIPPPIASTQILGTTIEPFDLKDGDGKLLLDAAEPKRPITILCWVGEDPLSESFVRELLNVRRTLIETELSARSQMFLVGRETSTSLSQTLKKWNCDLPLAIDRTGISETLFKIPGEPSIIILDRERRVQVSEYVTSPAAATAIPGLVKRIDSKEDLASRQLQQDVDNQARFIAALHRVAIDKEETAKLPPIREFQFALHGMRLDWREEFADPLVSAGGAWYPEVAIGGSPPANYPFSGVPKANVLAALDETGKVLVVDDLGGRSHVASVESEQADGAQRIHTAIDPWTHQWIAIVPEGLPRFWIAPMSGSLNPSTNSAPPATTYNTQDLESPVALAWGAISNEPALTLATSAARVLVINPKTEQRKDALGDVAIAIAPGLDTSGRVAQWSTVTSNGRLTRIRTLTGASGLIDDAPIEARLEQLTFEPKPGAWIWGRNGSDAVTLCLAGLPSGETGVVVGNALHQALRSRPITVRPEQTRLLSTARLPDGTLYCLATGPNRVLHLFTADLQIMDQASLDARILSASLFANGQDLKLVVALEKEVCAWTIDVPDRTLASPAATSTDSESTKTESQ